MQNILLRFDKAFGMKLALDKQKRECELLDNLTWEEYIKLLFGMAKK